MRLPFKHFFCGHWMSNPGLYPGYTAPRFLKNGKCIFNSPLHSGVQVDGTIVQFPADNPDLAIHHYSFRSVPHYQVKQNDYTGAEAKSMFEDRMLFDWRRMLQHSFGDLMSYYDAGKAGVVGPYGLIYSLLSANYRLLQHAKLFEMRANAGLLQPQELSVPQSTADILAVMAQMLNQKPKPMPEPIVVADSPEAADYVLTGPAFDRSGYAEEFRNALFALDCQCAEALIRVQSLLWNDDPDIMTESDKAKYEMMRARPAKPGFTHIIWDFPGGWRREPGAGRTIVRTMHETDRFPELWVQASHQVDEIWVPTEFNRKTAIDSGIDPGKIKVIPGSFDIEQEEPAFTLS
jgi:glycosyltransferase involved in cell wall biosynthesis